MIPLRCKSIFFSFCILHVALALLLAAGGCKKYGRAENVSDAAYIRVFNSITTRSIYQPGDTLNQLAPSSWVAFLFDPVLDADGYPMDAQVLGDFLGPMQPYYLPQQVRPGQKATGQFTSNYNEDYPGVQPVLAAPVISGLDLSRYAQASSGKHRVLFAFRQVCDIPFPALPLSYRRPVIVDTTVDFEPGSFYTLEVFSKGAVPWDGYGLVVRKEAFAKSTFSPDKIYLNMFSFSTDSTILPETLDAYYCKYFDSSIVGMVATPVLEPETYLTTVRNQLSGELSAPAPYFTIPATPRDSFLYPNGEYRPQEKRPTVILRFYRSGENAANGNQPFYSVTSGDLYFAGNAAGMPFNGHGEGVLTGPLEQTITQNNYSSPSPMINTLELRVSGDKKLASSLVTTEHLVTGPGK